MYTEKHAGVPGVPGMSPNAPPPQIGNFRNRVDILDLTFGTTNEIGNRATLATGVTIPTRGSDDKTFDWEFHVQFNYYFGGPRGRAAPALQ